MSERVSLSLTPRTVIGKKVKVLRREGQLPATVYGKGVGPIAVQLNAKTFNDLYRRAGRTTLIDLQIPGQKGVAAFVHSLQRHPVSRAILHVDFLAVDLLVEMVVAVPVHIVGESPLVARNDALLNVVHSTLDVRALPTDVPSAINVDVSVLDVFDKTIHVSDVVLPPNVKLELAADELLVSLSQTRPEAEAEETVEEPASAEPELVRERREEDEG